MAEGLGWREFKEGEPELAAACSSLIYQYGVGLAFLATIRADGGPRVHPMCPLIASHGLFAFLIPSPKRRDLHRDPRYAMHSFAAEQNEDAFYLAGKARSVNDAPVRRGLQDQFLRERGLPEAPDGFGEQELFEFTVERCLHTVTTGHGDPHPKHFPWRAP